MLEPWPPASISRGPFRGLEIRQGFDLEPSLPDPAPAYLDPEGALHPALVEPLSALPFHSFPTPGARAALTARVLSASGRANLDDDFDPFVLVYRFAARQDMEPEVTGCLALVLLRGLLAGIRKQHRTYRPDPEIALKDPEYDAFAGQRARLRDTAWESIWAELSAAANYVGNDPALAFERATLKAAVTWLEDYRAWWDVAQHLEGRERLPEDTTELKAALARFSVDLGDAIDSGVKAERQFMETSLGRPEGYIDADWLLSQQLRSLRNLDLATRAFSLELHGLVRRCDVARVRTQIAYRAVLLRLWLAEDPKPIEDRVMALADPPHATTLGAGLGRLLGVILLSRLRRGESEGALELAERALRLAPEELSVRITANDLRYHFGERNAQLLRSLREERSRWDSVSVCLMGARVAGRLGEHSVSKHFRGHLLKNALSLHSMGGWAVSASELLAEGPGHDKREALTRLSQQELVPAVDDPLLHILFGPGDHAQALEDLEVGLLDACLREEELDDLESEAIPGGAKKRTAPAWKQLLAKKIVSVEHAEFTARLWSRVQSLRAANPEMRTAPLAGEIRQLQELLSRAAELGILAPLSLGTLLERLEEHLLAPSQSSGAKLAAWIAEQRDPLRIALRVPRQEELLRELGVLASRARLADEEERLGLLSRLRAQLADPQSDLDEIDAKLNALQSADFSPSQADEPNDSSDLPLMSFHAEFDAFSTEELGIRSDALRRARELVRLFNLSGGQRDRKRLKGKTGSGLFELRHRTTTVGGLRVFYRREGRGWIALAAMSKYDDRQQQEAIDRVARHFADPAS